MPDVLDFDEFVDLLRERLGAADAIAESRLHQFTELMKDYADVIPRVWYWQAFEELDADGHLSDQSAKLNGGDACGRLSADGRLYLRTADVT